MKQEVLNEIAFALVIRKLVENRLPIIDNSLRNEFRLLQNKYNITAEDMRNCVCLIWNRLTGKTIVEAKETAEVKLVAYYSVLEKLYKTPMPFGERSAKELGQMKKAFKELGFQFTTEDIEEASNHFQEKWFEMQKIQLEKLIR